MELLIIIIVLCIISLSFSSFFGGGINPNLTGCATYFNAQSCNNNRNCSWQGCRRRPNGSVLNSCGSYNNPLSCGADQNCQWNGCANI